MIAVCGLPTGNFDDTLVNDAFKAYRNKDQRAAFQAKHPLIYNAKIKMVGVWDTVGSLGIPAIFGGVEADYAFLDTGLHPDVLNAYQALSIDERRQEFPPTLWTPSNPVVPGQTLEQVWFSGVHCDVGGGNPDTGLANITLSWMINQAKNLGLQLKAGFLGEYLSVDSLNALDTIDESWSPQWLFPKRRTVPDAAKIANSVAIRLEYDTTYRPPNLQLNDDGDGLDNSYQMMPVVTPPSA